MPRFVLRGLLVLSILSCSNAFEVGQNGRSGSSYDECGNGMDDDVDGLIDESCPCSPSEVQSCFGGRYPNRLVGLCRDGIQHCRGDGGDEFGVWAGCEGDLTPGQERCDGELDDDCDGAIDEGCACGAGISRMCGLDFVGGAMSEVGICRAGSQSCGDDGLWSSCEGAVGPAAELCSDSLDNDCDGFVNEGCECIPEPEVCGDGIDNDCDGVADEASCAGGTCEPLASEEWIVHAPVRYPQALTVDPSGNVTLVESWMVDAAVGVLSFDPSGTLRWQQPWNHSNLGPLTHVTSVASDERGDVYGAGYVLDGTVDLGMGALGRVDANTAFLFKLRGDDGTLLWTRAFSLEIGPDAGSTAGAFPSDLKVFAGGLYMVGDYFNAPEHGVEDGLSLGGPTLPLSSSGIFLARLSPEDGSHVWSVGHDVAYSQAQTHVLGRDPSLPRMALDSTGLYLTCGVGDADGAAANLGGAPLTVAAGGSPASDIAVAAYDLQTGGHRWSRTFGAGGIDRGDAIALSDVGLHVAATFTGRDVVFGSAQLDSGADTMASTALLWLSREGEISRATRLERQGHSHAIDLAARADGSLYISGGILFEPTMGNAQVDFGGMVLTETLRRRWYFFLRLGPEGEFLSQRWVRTEGSPRLEGARLAWQGCRQALYTAARFDVFGTVDIDFGSGFSFQGQAFLMRLSP